MKVHYITCAQSSSLDTKTNQLSLFHILDEISGTAFPLVLPSICVAALFEREAEEGPTPSFVMAVTLDGKLLASFTLSTDFTHSRRSRTVNTVQGLTLPEPGALAISLLQKTRVLAEWRAPVIRGSLPGGEGGAGAKPAAGSGAQAGAPKNALAVN